MKIINDVPFRSFFGKEENKEILSVLVSEIIKEKYEYVKENIKYLNRELERININDKGNITDILIEVGKYVIDIEAYTSYSERKRMKNIIYITKILNRYYNYKNEYNGKKEIVQINIIDRKGKDEEYYVKSEEKKYVKNIKIIEKYIDTEGTLLYTKSELANIELWKLLLGCQIRDTKKINTIINKMNYRKEIKEQMKGEIKKHMTPEDVREIGTTWEERLNLEIADARDEGAKSRNLYIATKLICENMPFKKIAEITDLPIEKIKDLSCNIKIKAIKH